MGSEVLDLLARALPPPRLLLGCYCADERRSTARRCACAAGAKRRKDRVTTVRASFGSETLQVAALRIDPLEAGRQSAKDRAVLPILRETLASGPGWTPRRGKEPMTILLASLQVLSSSGMRRKWTTRATPRCRPPAKRARGRWRRSSPRAHRVHLATQYQRTQKTAAPLAEQAGAWRWQVHAADERQAWSTAEKRQERALVVGHSNTLPEIREGLRRRRWK